MDFQGVKTKSERAIPETGKPVVVLNRDSGLVKISDSTNDQSQKVSKERRLERFAVSTEIGANKNPQPTPSLSRNTIPRTDFISQILVLIPNK